NTFRGAKRSPRTSTRRTAISNSLPVFMPTQHATRPTSQNATIRRAKQPGSTSTCSTTGELGALPAGAGGFELVEACLDEPLQQGVGQVAVVWELDEALARLVASRFDRLALQSEEASREPQRAVLLERLEHHEPRSVLHERGTVPVEHLFGLRQPLPTQLAQLREMSNSDSGQPGVVVVEVGALRRRHSTEVTFGARAANSRCSTTDSVAECLEISRSASFPADGRG